MAKPKVGMRVKHPTEGLCKIFRIIDPFSTNPLVSVENVETMFSFYDVWSAFSLENEYDHNWLLEGF